MNKILKFIVGLFVLCPQLLLAQVPSSAPTVGVPDNTQCLSTGNNGVCNQYRPGGPSTLTGAETLPAYTNTGNQPSAVLVPIDTLTAYTAKNLAIYSQTRFDFAGDSRTRDIYPSVCSAGAETPVSNCGTRGTNWFVWANALLGQPYQIGLVTAMNGARTDQYLAQANISPMLTSKSAWFVIGYPAINDIGPLSGGNYTNTNGVLVTPSNVANVATSNILGAVKQAIAVGKKVILLHEPGNTSTNNNVLTVASFSGVASGTILNVTSVASGIIYTPQTWGNPGSQQLGGAGVTAGTNIVAQLTGTNGVACPDVSCNGGIGTYQISNSLSLSQSFTGTYSLIASLYEFNSNLDAIGANYNGQVYVINNNPALWNFTGSATAVNFKPGINIDGNGSTSGTHYNALGGYYGAISFNAAFQTIIAPYVDLKTASIADISTANIRSLGNNPLFQTAAGGTNSTCTISSGTVPALWQTACGAGTTSLTITQGADTNLLYSNAALPLGGNAVTIAITAGAADTFRFFSAAPSNGLWNLTDYLQGNLLVNVANGSSKCRVYSGLDIATDQGTRPTYSLNSADDTPTNGGSIDGPTTAYTFTLQNLPVQARTGSVTKSFTRYPLYVVFSAAGNCTVTVSRPSLERVKVYNPITGTFSG